MRVSKETKFGYGFLLAGMGLPFLIDKLLGAVPALIVAAICNGPTDPDTKKVLINCKDRIFLSEKVLRWTVFLRFRSTEIR